MKEVFVVAGKEIKETLRDKRTLFFMIVFPLITFPLLINLISGITSSYIEEEKEKELRIGLAGSYNRETNPVIVTFNAIPKMELIALPDTTHARELIKSDSMDVVLYFEPGFEEAMEKATEARLTVIYEGTNEGGIGRVQAVLDTIEKYTVDARLKRESLPSSFIDPISLVRKNISTSRETIGKYAGGMLPYFFISFAFLGCLYPAIDMFAGEKERGTIETLLTVPVVRWKILAGKMLVVAVSGILAATLTMAGLFAGVQFMDMPGEVLGTINELLKPKLILTIYVMMIPLVIFFTGLMIPVSIYSKSFKEAQSTLTPLNLLLVLPAIVGLLPGVELNLLTSFIPVVNIVLATKDIIAGTIDSMLLGISMVTLILFAVGSVILSFKQFGKESNILR